VLHLALCCSQYWSCCCQVSWFYWCCLVSAAAAAVHAIIWQWVAFECLIPGHSAASGAVLQSVLVMLLPGELLLLWRLIYLVSTLQWAAFGCLIHGYSAASGAVLQSVLVMLLPGELLPLAHKTPLQSFMLLWCVGVWGLVE
jgi:hypothetical protein